jgi:GH24 family phage-related lysozyme (muramidase)
MVYRFTRGAAIGAAAGLVAVGVTAAAAAAPAIGSGSNKSNDDEGETSSRPASSAGEGPSSNSSSTAGPQPASSAGEGSKGEIFENCSRTSGAFEPREPWHLSVPHSVIYKRTKEEEGREAKVYADILGKYTAGLGHLMSPEEIRLYPKGSIVPEWQIKEWEQKDIKRVHDYCVKKASENSNYEKPNVAKVIFDMSFQLGDNGCDGFEKMHKAIQEGRFEDAAEELMKSKYAGQTPKRAKRNYELLRNTK